MSWTYYISFSPTSEDPLFILVSNSTRIYNICYLDFGQVPFLANKRAYVGPAKSSVTNRLPKFYPRYILQCFTALEWCVE